MGDRDRDAAADSSRARRHRLPAPRALDRGARVRGRDAQGLQPLERRLTNGLVSVVIVTWNSAPFLRRCLAALAAQTYRPIELIHVDNASSDDSVAIVRECATAQHIINDTNRGFSAAVNHAVRVANGEFVLLLNPDAYLEPDYVSSLVSAMDGFGMATGKLLQADSGFVDSKGIRMTRSGRHFDIGQGSRESGVGSRRPEKTSDSDTRHPTPDTQEVFGVSGAAAMYRATFITDVTVGGEFLDEDFFAFREDADVAWRGRLFGWKAIYVPEAVAHHVRTVTPEKRRALSAVINMHGVKNRFLLRLKNEGLYLALRNAPFELTRDLIVILATLTIERSSLPALTWLWKNRRRIMEKRRAIQSRRRISDRDLAGWFV
ncbi:MAG: glycosyltransferase family 2 protein [Acidobacteria bacterium]|nr:glycosyltransferase family 2 protein [Acidobacteriota bacterium]MBV9071290.1 glycosyltransferase family 2 protein [Acidobacteriota bacterium]MBV9187562.1 glycosyltransferase family 2 protein [Acidobacteriota bacterium]